MIRIVHSQELNKIMKLMKNGGGSNDLYNPKLTCFDIFRRFLWDSLSSEASFFNKYRHTGRTELIHFPNPFP
jgi:hypothetical protein